MGANNILVVDDSDKFRTSVRNTLGHMYALTEAASEAEFRNLYRPYTFDLVILDMRLETEREGLRLLREILSLDELQPVIMVSAYGDTDAVIDSAEAGALMFLHKQEFSPELLARMVEAVLQQAHTRRQLAALQARIPVEHGAILGGANSMVRRARDQVRRASDAPDAVILVAGEPGAGHYQVALSIHEQSLRRASGPFVVTSGASLAEGNAAEALYGTPATPGEPHHKGLLEQAMGGVLLLENAPVLSASVSHQLWGSLRSRTFQLGELQIPLDVQLVAGASPDAAGRLADELAHADLETIRIDLPALRERREDIALLANVHLQTLRQQGRTPARTFSQDAIHWLEERDWPGNIEELNNTVEYAAIQSLLEGAECISTRHFPVSTRSGPHANILKGEHYQLTIARAEIALVEHALESHGNINNSRLAEMLGYSDRFAIARRLRKAFSASRDLAEEFPRAAHRFLSRSRAA